MNRYIVLIGHDGDTSKYPIKFSAVSYKDAYFVAGQKIIEKYPDLSDEECDLISEADMDNWDDICDQIFNINGFNISDVTEVDDDQNWT